MRKLVLSFGALCFLSTVYAQGVPEEKVVHLDESKTHRSFWYTKANARNILAQLYKQIGEDVKEKSLHQFKEMALDRLGEPVTFKVHEGIHFIDEAGGGFHTFTNKKDREKYMAKLPANSEYGIIVHVWRKGEDVVDTKEEEDAVLEYFRSLMAQAK